MAQDAPPGSTSRMETDTGTSATFDAWHPGLKSELPSELLSLVTLFRPENAELDFAAAKELSDFSGLPPADLICLRVERLVQHELLVWVTANLSVPDGPSYEELGVNLRSMVATIYEKYVVPDMAAVKMAYATARAEVMAMVEGELHDQLYRQSRANVEPAQSRPFLGWLFGGKPRRVRERPATDHPELVAIAHWQSKSGAAEDPLAKACLGALVKVIGAISGHRGRLPPESGLIARLVANYVCSYELGDRILKAIEPYIMMAMKQEGYHLLPAQEKPTVMNVKGASAAGKSTIRPQQRRLAEKLGIPWEDFALISPDYWRKYLLDYGSLGSNYKYAAMLTGQELEIIDKKLDQHMAKKALRGEMSHLLIDRFRFDSFVVENDRSSDSKLLTRFGDQIFLFFMITPPAETVERAWQRGIKTGRYKAVDDLLYHNVEAYTGMPGLFFSWVRSKEKRMHFEFLDNDVPEGELPRTAAFGWNNTMTILDVNAMINIDRFRKVNVGAASAGEIFNRQEMAADRNTGFLRKCAEQVPDIAFADQASGQVYARVVQGNLVWWDASYVERQTPESGVSVALYALGYQSDRPLASHFREVAPLDIEKEKHFTLGRWHGV